VRDPDELATLARRTDNTSVLAGDIEPLAPASRSARTRQIDPAPVERDDPHAGIPAHSDEQQLIGWRNLTASMSGSSESGSACRHR
jgi:hypothetical protein